LLQCVLQAQKLIIPKIDKLFKLTPEEIETARLRYESSRKLDEALLSSATMAGPTGIPKLPPVSGSSADETRK
jgi:hypothetical protein